MACVFSAIAGAGLVVGLHGLPEPLRWAFARQSGRFVPSSDFIPPPALPAQPNRSAAQADSLSARREAESERPVEVAGQTPAASPSSPETSAEVSSASDPAEGSSKALACELRAPKAAEPSGTKPPAGPSGPLKREVCKLPLPETAPGSTALAAAAAVPLAGQSAADSPPAGRFIWANPQPAVAAQPVRPPLPYDRLTPEERISVAVYEKVNRSVVHINTRSIQVDRFWLFEIPSEGEGSGMVLDRQGHILTNFHVIEDAREIRVGLYDGSTYDAELVGIDPPTDTAVLKIDAPPEALHPVTFGNSAELLVGQRVYAIGNPFGLERTMSTGIISSLHRTLPERHTGRRIKNIIQIDAAINPGNSGGPLLDSRGLMIGMNTAIASKTGESAGVGFAIPVNTIARVVPELIRNGRVTRPDSGIARVYQTEQGLLIAALTPGGPAERAGLRGPKVVRQRRREGPFIYERQYIDRSAADLIVAVDGKPVKTADEFLTAIESKRPGDTVVVTVIREGKRLDVPLQLGVSE